MKKSILSFFLFLYLSIPLKALPPEEGEFYGPIIQKVKTFHREYKDELFQLYNDIKPHITEPFLKSRIEAIKTNVPLWEKITKSLKGKVSTGEITEGSDVSYGLTYNKILQVFAMALYTLNPIQENKEALFPELNKDNINLNNFQNFNYEGEGYKRLLNKKFPVKKKLLKKDTPISLGWDETTAFGSSQLSGLAALLNFLAFNPEDEKKFEDQSAKTMYATPLLQKVITLCELDSYIQDPLLSFFFFNSAGNWKVKIPTAGYAYGGLRFEERQKLYSPERLLPTDCSCLVAKLLNLQDALPTSYWIKFAQNNLNLPELQQRVRYVGTLHSKSEEILTLLKIEENFTQGIFCVKTGHIFCALGATLAEDKIHLTAFEANRSMPTMEGIGRRNYTLEYKDSTWYFFSRILPPIVH